MSEPDIATKAPENDSHEDSKAAEPEEQKAEHTSILPVDTPAQSGASMGVSDQFLTSILDPDKMHRNVVLPINHPVHFRTPLLRNAV